MNILLAFLFIIPGILLAVSGMRKLPLEKLKYDEHLPGGGIGFVPWKYIGLSSGIFLMMFGVFIILEPYSIFLAYLVFWPGIILALVVHISYYPGIVEWKEVFWKWVKRNKSHTADDSRENVNHDDND